MLTLYLSSIIIGISIAAPVGPIGVLIMRRTLAYGQGIGLLSGLGVASADACYGFIAAFGLTAITNLLISQDMLLRWAGGLFLLYIGIKTLTSQPATESDAEAIAPRLKPQTAYTSTFFLTLTNPITIFAFLGIFSGLQREETGLDQNTLIVFGVFSGSLLWWLTLSTAIGLLRTRFTPRMMGWINRLSGVVIILFALNILS